MKKQKILSNAEIASFCSQTSMLLSAGITPVESMNILLHDTKADGGKEILETILSVCVKGVPLHHGLKATGVFPEYVIKMITIGEESGNLDVVMQSLADYYEREESVLSNVRNALTYPFIMLAMMVMVIFVLISKVLPIFKQVFIQLGSEMQGLGGYLMNLGDSLNKYSLVIVVILVITALVYVFFTRISFGRTLFHKIMMNLPLTKGFYEKVASGRFASGMALTLGSGMDTFTSLNMVSQMVGNKAMEQKIQLCQTALENGANLTDALVNSGIFSNLYSRMISVGFRTGTVDIIMNKIAQNYEKETSKKLNTLISIVEPTLVIILSVVVGFILLSVILPLMGIMSSIG